MSLKALPTELDEKIASFSENQQDLSALSKVSKYWNAIAEPLLYQAIEIDTENRYATLQLLLTLLEHPELALRIESLKFTKRAIRKKFIEYQTAQFLSPAGTPSDLLKRILP
ncbi:hypothetical protein EK21DRAFT_108022 [Setomelanomma holmii]|uniref:F-box domain-containing protein n=1 Tax=Setomelanomma holmii TaxID=210430 RepID=A0A9P4HIX1_9PLEO|nr:hypothetical protein EK21DRAFT_108022 [Setomelanomma holmii]